MDENDLIDLHNGHGQNHGVSNGLLLVPNGTDEAGSDEAGSDDADTDDQGGDEQKGADEKHDVVMGTHTPRESEDTIINESRV